ncbi:MULTISPECIES: ATP-binding protein [Vibrio]|uniref:ATP-binding protein n=1 Tax=Vibrio kanaloae TaxID=170673 RepID=A0ABV4LED0_9VIBR|nr:ATP-binding protein [Vibrio kanaloae]OEF15670.1 ATPase [Vibrio kanaloae 5S-149]
MKEFCYRQLELSELASISEKIKSTYGQLSVVVGKRRVGKTRLLKDAFYYHDTTKTLYFLVSRKSEAMLIHEFTDIIATELNVKLFKPESLKDIIEYLIHYSMRIPLTIIIDEFQDIERVSPSLFSDIQNLWDSYKTQSMMHLVCCGSMHNMMTKIFKGNDEPLMNRDDRFFRITPLKPSHIKRFMKDLGVFDSKNMLEWWCLTGGIPKYLKWLSLSTGHDNVFDYVISSNSPFLKEGTHRLVEDFGSEHQNYFDILNAISLGKTKRSDIQNHVRMGVDVHLEHMESNFNVITKVKPISSDETTRDSRFEIEDPFINFWFKFIHSNSSAVEMDNFDYIKAHIERDFDTFSVWQLKSLFKAILAESKRFNKIGGYWNAKGQDVIDIVAVNELEKAVLIAECQRQQSIYDEAMLIAKSQSLISKMSLQHYKMTYRGVSLDNLEELMEEFTPNLQ